MSDAVLAANQAFYDAFAARSIEAMEAIWASDAPVACVHPGRDAIHGREAVLASWRAILGSGNSPEIRCVHARAQLLGDAAEAAFVTCVELLPGAQLFATNIFVRERGRWLVAHHHAGELAVAPFGSGPPAPGSFLN